MIPDLLARYPQARHVLDRYGLRGCGGRLGPVESLSFFAATHGVDEDQLLDELQAAVHPRNAAVIPQPVNPRPACIASSHSVGDVVTWYPQTLDVFARFGFTSLANPVLRRTVARGVSVQQAAAIRKVPLDDLVAALNAAI
jgi:hypothetical protein